MLQWFHRLMPRQAQFYPLFEQHAAVIVSAARALRGMLTGGAEVKPRCRDVLALEHKADGIAREVLITLRTTFITPFDRTDIQSLINAMDDSVDQMQQTAKAIVLFEVTTFESEMVKMAEAIIECAEHVQRAVSMLPELAKNAAEINEICLHINRIEGEADEMHDRGLERLYQKAKEGNPMEFIRGNEIYNHLENTVDKLEDVANEIQGIVIEHV
jgi:predicted phosphate transport protein (TIGR00153 family)